MSKKKGRTDLFTDSEDTHTIDKEIPILINYISKNFKTINLKILPNNLKENIFKVLYGDLYNDVSFNEKLNQINSISYLDEILSEKDRSIFNECYPKPFDITVLDQNQISNYDQLFNQYIIEKLRNIQKLICTK